MASESIAPLTTRSAADSPSYALRAALAERLAAHRLLAREAGAMLTRALPYRSLAFRPGMASPPAKAPGVA
ncbi:hypothetical protein CR162_04115 [Pseudoroseomonas rhizosphaerae]|uniref:Uncharacterized protein n=1 Tax=Teichococcus rhizosphaerae TaxID=1335062 RepID=A0A2C7A8R8_9PROT|nr:hypothetical protein [Pseudoroseomonas rhizosphaerae]PHK96518.1 hypothetical protein CR162_04115 [Pseudoroseomonas rhizosphaerae]